MDHLPDELVRAIFCGTVTLPRVVLNRDRVYCLDTNATLAAQPYLLAAVSHRWREISLATAELWAYILLFQRTASRSLIFVKQNLARSGDQPLVIVLNAVESRDQHFGSTLKLLVEHASRRLRVHIKLDKWSPRLHKIQLIQACASCTMPMLEELVVMHGELDAQLAVCKSAQLLDCPRLIRLINHVGILTPTTTLGTLKYLSISMLNTNEAPLWAALSMAPALEHLDVYFPEGADGRDEDALVPEHDIHLSSLTSFAVFGSPPMVAPWTERLQMPHLQKLTVSIDACDRLSRFYQTIRSSTLHLILTLECCGDSGDISAAVVKELRSLRAVSTLEIMGVTGSLSDDGFFHALEADARQDSTCWAAQFTQLVFRECFLDSEATQAVAHFVRTRASAADSGGDAPRLNVQRIVSSHEEDEVIPDYWSNQ